MQLTEILASAAVSTALAGILIWLTRVWLSERLKASIKSEYDQKLETHKAQLAAASNVALEKLRAELTSAANVESEKLRSQLNLAATEHQVKFTRLHDKRAEIIAEAYSLLTQLFEQMEKYVAIFEPAGGPPRQERRNAAANAYEEFAQYYVRRKIFFPALVASKLDQITEEFRRAFNEFVIRVDVPNPEQEHYKVWMEIFDRVRGDMRAALDGLEKEFRSLLRDTSSERHEAPAEGLPADKL